MSWCLSWRVEIVLLGDRVWIWQWNTFGENIGLFGNYVISLLCVTVGKWQWKSLGVAWLGNHQVGLFGARTMWWGVGSTCCLRTWFPMKLLCVLLDIICQFYQMSVGPLLVGIDYAWVSN